MTDETGVSLSPIERLPLELLQQILYRLEDSETLQSTVLSCPLFCNLYKEAKPLITFRVQNVDIQVLPEILTAFETSQLNADSHDAQDKAILDDLVQRNLQQKPKQPSWAKISQMVPYLWRFYPIVDYFSRRFADEALTRRRYQWGEEVYERSTGLQDLLAAGLERVYRFLEGETYEDKETVVFLDMKYPVQNQAFGHLNVMFWTARDPRLLYDKLPHCSDPDPGPEKSWRQIHTGTDVGIPSELVYHDEGSALRQCAYVMWDESRLKKAKLFKNPFYFEEEQRLPWMAEEELKRYDRRMRESWMRRTSAYQLGCRGRYSQLHDDMKHQVEQKTAEQIAKRRVGERVVTPITRRGSI